MAVDNALFQVLGTGVLGLGLSVGLECFLRPQPLLLGRPIGAWCIHAALWCAVYAILVLLLGRVWCAMAAASAILLTLVLVSNAKIRSLREPFLFQDYDYFLDALRFPRLFLPFLGVKNFCLAAVCFVAAIFCLLAEIPPTSRFFLNGQLGGALGILLAALALVWVQSRTQSLPLRFVPEEDMRLLGLTAFLWAYATTARTAPTAVSPFRLLRGNTTASKPHLIAVQSESFFDARSLFHGIRPEVLNCFDAMCTEAALHGPLQVPAWGANTVRTEFSFLTGIAARDMGVHQFNPYQTIAGGWMVDALPQMLKRLGYRTVCIHPYWASFYSRDRVLRQLGFEEFLDISAFSNAERAGAYVSDKEVGRRILELLHETDVPTFCFVITMENHGPLHLDTCLPDAGENFYHCLPPPGCEELDAYLRHLRHADQMLHLLRDGLEQETLAASLCFYGDHVPIMPTTYKVLQAPEGLVPYLCWHTRSLRKSLEERTSSDLAATHAATPQHVHKLSLQWLQSLCMLNKES